MIDVCISVLKASDKLEIKTKAKSDMYICEFKTLVNLVIWWQIKTILDIVPFYYYYFFLYKNQNQSPVIGIEAKCTPVIGGR